MASMKCNICGHGASAYQTFTRETRKSSEIMKKLIEIIVPIKFVSYKINVICFRCVYIIEDTYSWIKNAHRQFEEVVDQEKQYITRAVPQRKSNETKDKEANLVKFAWKNNPSFKFPSLELNQEDFKPLGIPKPSEPKQQISTHDHEPLFKIFNIVNGEQAEYIPTNLYSGNPNMGNTQSPNVSLPDPTPVTSFIRQDNSGSFKPIDRLSKARKFNKAHKVDEDVNASFNINNVNFDGWHLRWANAIQRENSRQERIEADNMNTQQEVRAAKRTKRLSPDMFASQESDEN